MKIKHNIFLKFNFYVILSIFFVAVLNFNAFAIVTNDNKTSQNSATNSPSATVSNAIDNSSGTSNSNANNSGVSSSSSKVNSSTSSSNKSRVAVNPPSTSTKTQHNENSSATSQNSASSTENNAATIPEQKTQSNYAHSQTNAQKTVGDSSERNSENTSNAIVNPSSSNEVASNRATSEKNNKDKKETSTIPEDLPKVESSEIDFPEIVSPTTSTDVEPANYFAGIIAWSCILVGIAIVIFVMIKGRSNQDVPIQNISGQKRRRRKGRHLLPNDYYRDKF